MHDWYSEVCDNDQQTMLHFPEDAVRELQGKAPGASRKDRDELRGKIDTMFGNFTEQQRRTLWTNICNASRTCLIPSLYTFFEDRKFLAEAATCMRAIVDTDKGTIATALQRMFQGDVERADRCTVQISDTSFGVVPGDPGLQKELAEHQLWLAAFRNCKEISTKRRRRNALAKPRSDTNEVALYNFAALASRLGFRSERIETLLRTSPDQLVAERALITARDPRSFYYPDKERCVQRVAEIFRLAAPNLGNAAARAGAVVIHDQPPIRQGLPYDADHERDKLRIFVHQLDKGLESGGGEVSSIFIRWSVYCAFFGRPPSVADCMPEDSLQENALPCLNRYRLSNSVIKKALQPESEPQDVEGAQSELMRLQALVAAEQDRVDEKDILLERAHEELRRLETRQQEESQKLYHLLQKVREAEGKLYDLARTVEVSEAVVVDVPESRHDEQEGEVGSIGVGLAEVGVADAGVAEDSGGVARNRVTQFDFADLAEDSGWVARNRVTQFNFANLAQGQNRIPERRIGFKELQHDGSWRLADDVEAEQGAVQHAAMKFVDKGLLLFDQDGNNLTIGTCFHRLKISGADCVYVKEVDKASTLPWV